MPPRQRGRLRKGQKREDAALDAMLAYGFPQRLIAETLKELLELYGTDGWTFIEDCAYKVLLEAILEKVEKEEQEKVDAANGEMGSNSIPACSAVHGAVTALPTNEINDTASQTNEVVSSAFSNPETGEGSCSKVIEMDTTCGRNRMRSASERVGSPSESLGRPGERVGSPGEKAGSPGERAGSIYETVDENSVGAGHRMNITPYPFRNPIPSPILVDGRGRHPTEITPSSSMSLIPSPNPVDCARSRNQTKTTPCYSPNFSASPKSLESVWRRKSCHGWIDGENDNEDDLMELSPEPLSEELQRLLLGANGQKKRKSWWDVRPEDL